MKRMGKNDYDFVQGSNQRQVRVYQAINDAADSDGGWRVQVKRENKDGTLDDNAFYVGTLIPKNDIPPVLAGDRVLIVLTWDGIRVAVPISAAGGGANIRCFQPVIIDSSTIGIRAGYWWRSVGNHGGWLLAPVGNFDDRSLDPSDVKPFDVSGWTGLDWYAVVALVKESGNAADEFFPYKIEYAFTQDFETFQYGGTSNVSNTETNVDRWDGYRLLFQFRLKDAEGSREIESIREIYHEGAIEDFMMAPDGDLTNTFNNGAGRKTLEYCTDYEELKNSLQMHNVATVEFDVYAIPYFESAVEGEGGLRGELKWATIDAKENASEPSEPTYASIDVEGGFLSLFGFQTAYDWTVGYKNAAKELEWKYPVTANDNPAGAEPVYFTALTDIGESSPDTEDPTSQGVVAIVISGGLEFRVDKATLDIKESTGSKTVYAKITSIDPKWIPHNGLDFAPTTAGIAGQNKDHDKRYVIQGDDHEGTAYLDTIGYGTSPDQQAGTTPIRIDLGNCRLVRQTGDDPVVITTDLDWQSHYLYLDWTVEDNLDVGADLDVGGDLTVTGTVESTAGFICNELAGVSGTFEDNDGNTITVTGGIITDLGV
jgi:hypothetical protein